MTRGNQRELAREKNLKKQQSLKEGTTLQPGQTLEQKRLSDAAIMRGKQQKAAIAAVRQRQGNDFQNKPIT